MTESRHREAFEEFAQKAEEELGDSLEKLYLYGSVARGEQEEDSDVDIFAVVKDDDHKDKLYDLAASVGRAHGIHLAVVARNISEYRKTRDTFFTREVMSSGEAVV